ncbi:calcium/sodium antiporter [Halovenus marina]|uniref:calcium/sodium antiporter n=1 Tax=Halovenus marina TaxID=3396621 RepID=UPI003F56190A
MSLLSSVAVFVVALAFLLVASEWFTSAAERLALAAGVSPFLIGATIVAGGTSLPELVSSVLAAVEGEPGIALGTAVGSNIANIFLVLGIAAVAARHLQIDRELVRVDLPLLMASAVFLLIVAWNGSVRWYEGLIGLLGLAVYVHFTLSTRTRLDEVVDELVEEHTERAGDEAVVADGVEPDVTVRTYAVLVGSLGVVFVAASQLVGSLLAIAAALDVGTELVAMTAVAVGTSLPEISVSLSAIRRGSSELTVGNVLGSNVFNTFAVVGVPALLVPVPAAPSVRTFALPVMILATLLYYFITQDREITRWEGLALVLLYAAFVVNLAP